MTFNEFKKLAKEWNTIPVYTRILSDLLTPISTYMRLSKNSNYAFILESVEGGKQYARYSFIGRNPKSIIRSKKNKTQKLINGKWNNQNITFLEQLRKIQSIYKTPKLQGLPNFTGGLVGFLGYESITWIEKIPIHKQTELKIPDAIFMLYEELIVFDHLKNEIILFYNARIKDNIELKIIYEKAKNKINKIGEDLHTDIDFQPPNKFKSSPTESNFTNHNFKVRVIQAQEYIKSGEIFQLVLSQKFKRKSKAKPDTIYRALRTVNPSPYMFHLKLNSFDIIGASPELLVKVEDNEIEIRPIAGTRPRGKSKNEDKSITKNLLNDKKECAEHLMLVDLGRNDIGKAAEFGTVKVHSFMEVEYYSHVMHIVSDIKGNLCKDKDVIDALYCGFPAGTLTGAPKIRAMEIINKLESERRGIYSGAIGYFDFSGDMNTCIAIRTMIIKNGIVYFQSGAGIVYDSIPKNEFEETINKAKAINIAIDLAENGLVS